MNLRPPGYEPGELPDCSTPHYMCAPKGKEIYYAPFPCGTTLDGAASKNGTISAHTPSPDE